jgi:thiol:disulfide interchange protein DsbA
MLAAVTGLAGAVELKEGQQYTVYRPAQPTETKGKIEVTEFFWYGCGHCFNLEPLLVKWLKKLPKDVVFRRVPAVFPGRGGEPGPWAPGAKIYYTLETMGLLDKLHDDVFEAVHVDRLRLINDDAVLFDWMAKKGVDARKFADIYNSFAIQSKVRRSIQLTDAHGLDGVPALIVDGRYKPATGAGGSYDDALVVVDQLIDMARKDHAAKK